MILERFVWKVKQGCMQEAVALSKSFAESAGTTCRIYTSNIGPHSTLVIDQEFETLAQRGKFWVEWDARPETPALWEKWLAVTETGGYTEIWNLVE